MYTEPTWSHQKCVVRGQHLLGHACGPLHHGFVGLRDYSQPRLPSHLHGPNMMPVRAINIVRCPEADEVVRRLRPPSDHVVMWFCQKFRQLNLASRVSRCQPITSTCPHQGSDTDSPFLLATTPCLNHSKLSNSRPLRSALSSHQSSPSGK